MQIDQLVNAYLAFQSTCAFDGLADTAQRTAALSENVITITIIDLFCALSPFYRQGRI